MNFFIARALELAQKSQQPLKCGVVIEKNGEIIAESFNKQREACDATAHAEILAIKQAGKVLGTKNLNGSNIYCTCEPCLMCFSAILYAGLDSVNFAVPIKRVSRVEEGLINLTTDEVLANSNYSVAVNKSVDEEEVYKQLYAQSSAK